jgi:hypothetical protein
MFSHPKGLKPQIFRLARDVARIPAFAGQKD